MFQGNLSSRLGSGVSVPDYAEVNTSATSINNGRIGGGGQQQQQNGPYATTNVIDHNNQKQQQHRFLQHANGKVSQFVCLSFYLD